MLAAKDFGYELSARTSIEVTVFNELTSPKVCEVESRAFYDWQRKRLKTLHSLCKTKVNDIHFLSNKSVSALPYFDNRYSSYTA